MTERDYGIFRLSFFVGLVEGRFIPFLFGTDYSPISMDRGLSVERDVSSNEPYRSRFFGTEDAGYSGFYIPPRSNGRRSHRKIVRTRNVNFRNARRNKE